MAEKTKIEWTEATWNPWHGCHKVSPGCKNCYMFREKKHYGQDPDVVLRSKTKFYDPLKWKEPRTIFTCSWSDFFIEEADPWRDEAFTIMALTPQHTYQVLTKRPDRMQEYFNNLWLSKDYCSDNDFFPDTITNLLSRLGKLAVAPSSKLRWPLPNVWLGVSVEDQKTANERIPLLLNTPASLRWLSIEPLLGPVDLTHIQFPNAHGGMEDWNAIDCCVMENGEDDPTLLGIDDPIIDWVVVGGESGPDARPMHPDWARSLRDQCTAAGVPFFMKQMTKKAQIPDDLLIREFPKGESNAART